MTRGEMLERISSRELGEWRAYERVTGVLGSERDDSLASLVAYYVVSGLGGKVKPADLMPQWDRPPATDWRQMKQAAMALTRRLGGEIRNRTSSDPEGG